MAARPDFDTTRQTETEQTAPDTGRIVLYSALTEALGLDDSIAEQAGRHRSVLESAWADLKDIAAGHLPAAKEPTVYARLMGQDGFVSAITLNASERSADFVESTFEAPQGETLLATRYSAGKNQGMAAALISAPDNKGERSLLFLIHGLRHPAPGGEEALRINCLHMPAVTADNRLEYTATSKPSGEEIDRALHFAGQAVTHMKEGQSSLIPATVWNILEMRARTEKWQAKPLQTANL